MCKDEEEFSNELQHIKYRIQISLLDIAAICLLQRISTLIFVRPAWRIKGETNLRLARTGRDVALRWMAGMTRSMLVAFLSQHSSSSDKVDTRRLMFCGLLAGVCETTTPGADTHPSSPCEPSRSIHGCFHASCHFRACPEISYMLI